MSRTGGDMEPYLNITEVSCVSFTMVKMFASYKTRVSADMLLLSSITLTGASSSQSALNGARDFLEENGALKDLRIEPALGVTETGSIVSNWRMADPLDWTEGYQGRLELNFEAKVMTYETEDGNKRA
jgi:hypothetical protein